MSEKSVTVVISGHMRKHVSNGLIPFWLGFIELQSRIPKNYTITQVVCHSWNPELAELAKIVYAPLVGIHEEIKINNIATLKKESYSGLIDNCLNIKCYILNNEIKQSLFASSQSRSKAVSLITELSNKSQQVLMVNWDLGQTESTDSNRLIFDSSLPVEYLYLSNSDDIDNGYIDHWLLASWEMAKTFEKYDIFTLESINGDNLYLDLRTKSGWPRSRRRNRYEIIAKHSLVHNTIECLNKNLKGYSARTKDGLWKSQFRRILRKITSYLDNYLSKPILSTENSCMPGYESKLTTYPESQAINGPSILKYFIHCNALRERTRFLTQNDFEIELQSGQLINPQQTVLIICEEENEKVQKLLNESPLPLLFVYQIVNGLVREYERKNKYNWSSKILQHKKSDNISLTEFALIEANIKIAPLTPVLIMPSADKYLNCFDWFYLNALLKFISWKNVSYVDLNSGKCGKSQIDFPSLNVVRSEGLLSFKMVAGTVEGLASLIAPKNTNQSEIYNCDNKQVHNYLVISQNKKLF